jgi:hypothetical protein
MKGFELHVHSCMRGVSWLSHQRTHGMGHKECGDYAGCVSEKGVEKKLYGSWWRSQNQFRR